MKVWSALLSGLLAVASGAHAEDLIAVYERALASDPQIREANATRLANREARPQALANLLPLVSGTAAYQRDQLSGPNVESSPFVITPGSPPVTFVSDLSGSGPRTTRTWNVGLRQNLFSWANWVTLKRASRQVAQAEADYAAAEQSLIQRVAQRYFDVLAAKDNLEAQEAALDSISHQLEQSEKRFEVGLIAVTDVEDAKAARDNGTAAVIDAKRTLSNAVEALREVTGQQYDELAKPSADLPLTAPDPIDVDRWVQTSMDQNLTLISSRLAADIARDDVSTAFSGHLPTIDLSAARSNDNVRGNTSLNTGGVASSYQSTNDTEYAVQLNVPIFSGGATQSRVRQAQYLWIAAKARLEGTSRQTELQARDAYYGVISGISRVNSLRQARESSLTALNATEAGYEVGTRTAVEVLDARRTLVQAVTNYSRSRYDYINDVIALRLAAGTLDRRTLEEINGWLDRTTLTK
jgi:outer membrane protein